MNNFYELTPDQQAERLEALAGRAVGRWGIPESAELDVIKHRENAVFRVKVPDSGKRYVLRVHRHGYHSDAELRSELLWMKVLNESGIRTPEVVAGTNGDDVQVVSCDTVPEPRQCDLFEWVDGEALGQIDGDLVSDPAALVDNYRTVGELAGRLHNQTENWPLPEGFARHAWDEDGICGQNPVWGRFWELEPLTAAQREPILTATREVRDRLVAFGKGKDRYGLIHADFLPENLLVGKDGIRLIDFDDCGFGWHLFDLVTPLFFHLGEDHSTTCTPA
jgi:Ser/Thr protein kinase RdoA (MazF antagonist)